MWSVILFWEWAWSDEPKCKCNCQCRCNQNPGYRPNNTLDTSNPPTGDKERCTCGTEYDFDGIPRRKSCKKHGY